MAARSEAAYPVTWKNGRVASWLVTVDHKRIGIMYVATSIVHTNTGIRIHVIPRVRRLWIVTMKLMALRSDAIERMCRLRIQ